MKSTIRQRFALVFVAALAVMSLGAASASADYIEVRNGDTEEVCGDATSAEFISGGCTLVLEGDLTDLLQTPSGTNYVADCWVRLAGAVDSSGRFVFGTLLDESGYTYSALSAGGEHNAECESGWTLKQLPWEGQIEADGEDFVANTHFAHNIGWYLQSGEATFELEEDEPNSWAFDTNGYEHLGFNGFGWSYGIETRLSPTVGSLQIVEVEE